MKLSQYRLKDARSIVVMIGVSILVLVIVAICAISVVRSEVQKRIQLAQEAKLEQDLAAARNVEGLIGDINLKKITADSGSDLSVARDAYDSLSSDQKEMVGNLEKLESAEKKYQDILDDIAKAQGTDRTQETDAEGTDQSQETDAQGTITLNPSEKESEENGDYIIEDSDTRYLSISDIKGLSRAELRLARNEIYARRGRRFNDQTLQRYFDSKDWYSGTIEPDDFQESMLNDYERKNAVMIRDYENSL